MKTHDLAKGYKKILDRKEVFIALGDNSLDVILKDGFRLVRSIRLPGSRTFDLALHPGARISFVTIKDKFTGKNKILGNQIIGVDEKTGKVMRYQKAYGQSLAMNPSGTRLFASINEMFYYGQSPYSTRYQNVDLLISYDVYAKSIILDEANDKPGANCSVLCVSPNGKYVSLVAGGGLRAGPSNLNGYTVGTFDAKDVKKVITSYRTGAYPKVVAHHSMLNLAAAGTEKRVQIFEQSTGKIVTGKVEFPAEAKKIHYVTFTPGGKHLLTLYTGKDNLRVLQSLPLRLSSKEKALVMAGYTQPKIIVRKEPLGGAATTTGEGTPQKKSKPKVYAKVKMTELNGIKAAGKTAMSTSKIADTYMDAVVIIKHSKGSGTGFFISTSGHVLTCAHVIPHDAPPSVAYRLQKRFIRAKSKLIAIDRRRDLALLKITPMGKIASTLLPKSTSVSTGASTSLIGHPGLGDKILDYTMTSGIVSNPGRMIDGLPYIQTNASINPGMSGGPMFDKYGNVIGVVVLKARIEGVGMAVPHKDIIEFIKASAK